MRASRMILVIGALALLLMGCAASQQEQQSQRMENMSTDVAIIAQPTEDPERVIEGNDAPPAPNLAEPLTLDDCINFALNYNLEALAKAQEKLVQDELIHGAWFRALPQLIVQAENRAKSTHTPSSSESYRTRQQSLEPSFSEDINQTTASVELSWDLLNLATSVFRAQQEGMRSQIAEEQLRRIKQNVAVEITEAYLRAAVARDLAAKSIAVLDLAQERQGFLDRMLAEELVPRNEWLQNRIDIKEMQIQLASFEEEFDSAKALLAELMGVKDTDFELAGYDFANPPIGEAFDRQALENVALRNRPELFEKDLDQQIAQQDVWVATARMFPSLTPFYRYDYTSNSFYLKDHWYTWGLRLSWDLLNIPEFISESRTAIRKKEMEMKRRLQLSLAILTQLRLALLEYEDAEERLPLAKGVAEERGELLMLVENMVRDGKLQESLLLEENNRYLSARQRYLEFYSEIVVSRARIRNSLGLDWQDSISAAGAVSAVQPVSSAPAMQAQEPEQAAAPVVEAPVAPNAAPAQAAEPAAPTAAPAREASPKRQGGDLTIKISAAEAQ